MLASSSRRELMLAPALSFFPSFAFPKALSDKGLLRDDPRLKALFVVSRWLLFKGLQPAAWKPGWPPEILRCGVHPRMRVVHEPR